MPLHFHVGSQSDIGGKQAGKDGQQSGHESHAEVEGRGLRQFWIFSFAGQEEKDESGYQQGRGEMRYEGMQGNSTKHGLRGPRPQEIS